MSSVRAILNSLRVKPGKKLRLKNYASDWDGDHGLSKAERKALAEQTLSEGVEALSRSQDLLFASDTYSILLIFQAMDAAGKDSTIKHVMSGINPQGCHVTSFKVPSTEELDHNFLWRYSRALPRRGRIGIFNRSYYEEVLVVKVHPEILALQRIPDLKLNKEFWQSRYNDINHFERHLSLNGTVILKFFLHLSRDEQRKRFLARVNDPAKHWKFSSADMKERAFWDDYMEAYEECLHATSTRHAPWYIIPADHKWAARTLVSQVVVTAIADLDLKYPEVTPQQQAEIADAKKKLEGEGA